MVAQEQRQWDQAEHYYQQALAIFVEFKDQHSIGITVRNAARLWQASERASVVQMVADLIGEKPEEVEARFRQVDAEEDEPEALEPAAPSQPPPTQPTGPAASPPPPAQGQEPEGITLEQLFDAVAAARAGNQELGGQLFGLFQQMAADPNQPDEVKALAKVLLRILIRDDNPDLSALPDELAQAVRALVARLNTG